MAQRLKNITSPQSFHFFKIYSPIINADQLRIPPEFMNRIKNQSLRTASLMGPSGNVWRVTLIKGFFKVGWKEFVTDHSLEHGDILIFKYDGDACFSVSIFDATACEKEGSFQAKPVKEEVIEGEVDDDALLSSWVLRRKKRRVEKGLVVWRATEAEMDLKPFSLTYSNCLSVAPNTRRSTYIIPSLPRKLIKSETIETPTSAPQDIDLRFHESLRRRQRMEMERGIYHVDSYEARNGKLRQGSMVSQRRPVTQEEKERALQAAKSFKSSNPFSLLVMRDAYVYSSFFMYLPTAFVMDYLPKTDQELTLWDPNGKAWTVKLVLGKGCGALSAGWAKFARVHNLERDDVCVLELIKEKELQVHIFRVVEEILPLLRSCDFFKKCSSHSM
ncbi:hypothetical protein QJS10_CPB17g00633 [Acorus calamus]|uniref:TF-B3 domain-containing protein n=1 Tax=Acorus calamus TaxID=4465 RepID=A0AAV9CVI1_ACOCL|nr:hypothetical protein QJS10_CPB17g00633 [Acorus calamus]